MRSTITQKQDGIALLVFVIIISLASFSYFMTTLSPDKIEIDKQQVTQQALQRAKAALISYAMNYPDYSGNPDQGPGNLPCPDDDFDGDSETTAATYTFSPGCNAALAGQGVFARFPWAALGMEELRDGNNEHLWYAVSARFADFAGNTINSSSQGTITVKNSDGINLIADGGAASGALAVIISPGQVITREDGVDQVRRTLNDQQNPVNYLDIAFMGEPEVEDNADFINGDSTNGFIKGPVFDDVGNVLVNDVVEVITYEDMMPYVEARAANDMRVALRSFRDGCGLWPRPTAFDSTQLDGSFVEGAGLVGHIPVDDADWGSVACVPGPAPVIPDWVLEEEWHKNTYYVLSDTADCGANCISDDNGVSSNEQFVLVFSGRLAAPGPFALPDNYFAPENRDGDDIYTDVVNDDTAWGFPAL